MTYFSYIRTGLISTALLLTTALASPALAESLPEISPRQIASDVEIQYHPETGAKEYLAPSFDPFEEDRTLAGTAALRSVSNGTTIDGQSVRGGALLDMTFYYNSASNDPYDTRGYEDAVYLSGEYAPVTYRDNRILECNEQVQDVVYYHEDYYRPSLYVNLFRPYRHYSGHYRYGGGYGYNSGYGYGRAYSRNRGFGSTSRGRNRIRNARRNSRDRSRGGFTERAADRVRGTDREDRTDNRRRGDRNRTRTRTDEERRNTRNNRRNREDSRTDRREGGAASTRRLQANDSRGSTRRDTRRNGRATQTRNDQGRNGQTTNRVVPQTPRTATPRSTSSSDSAAARAQLAANRSRAAEKSKNAPKRNFGGKGRSQTRNKNSQSKNTQRKNSQRKNRSQTRSKNSSSTRSQSFSRGRSKLKLINFLPMASVFSRNVVRNVDVQCAREEMLTVHIPQERLDAARFDGLTVLVLDRSGQEVPVFLPPNYIEGFRQAVSGRVTPSVSYQEPQPNAPVYQTPRPSPVESAPCPVGTTKQNDGTCLQGDTTVYGGYPTR